MPRTAIGEESEFYKRSFSSTREVELVGTICFLLKDNSLTLGNIVVMIQDWSERKKETFTPIVIEECVKSLVKMNILAKNLLEEYEMAV